MTGSTGIKRSCRVYSLDVSEAAAISEDYQPNRCWFQKELVTCLTRALLGVGADGNNGGQENLVSVVEVGRRARVTIPPTKDVNSVVSALGRNKGDGECNVIAGLKLALLTTRGCSWARVTAFIASAISLDRESTKLLVKSFVQSGVKLDVVLLCDRDQVGADSHTVVESLVQGINAGIEDFEDSSEAAVSSQGAPPSWWVTPCRLVQFSPPDPDCSLWQQLEPFLEKLEVDHDQERSELSAAVEAPGASPLPPPSTSTSQPSTRKGPLYSRLPRLGRHLTPSTCRNESLDSLQHLSADGFLRSWLPSYSTITKVVRQGVAAGGGPAYCYLTIYKVELPKWYTLLEVAAGRVDQQLVTENGRIEPEGCGPLTPGSLAAASCSSSGRAVAAARLWHSQRVRGKGRVMMTADPRAGRLSLVRTTDNSNVMRLIWTPHQSKAPKSLFEPGNGTDAEVGNAEVEVVASSCKTSFSVVPEPSGRVLRVNYNRGGILPPQTHYFWLQESWRLGDRVGVEALAEHLQELIQQPPEFEASLHGGSGVRSQGQPVQVGPIPLELLDEVMKASGKELRPDGTIVTLPARPRRTPATTGTSTSGTPSSGRHSNERVVVGSSGDDLKTLVQRTREKRNISRPPSPALTGPCSATTQQASDVNHLPFCGRAFSQLSSSHDSSSTGLRSSSSRGKAGEVDPSSRYARKDIGGSAGEVVGEEEDQGHPCAPDLTTGTVDGADPFRDGERLKDGVAAVTTPSIVAVTQPAGDSGPENKSLLFELD